MQPSITSCALNVDDVRRRGYEGGNRGNDDVACVIRLLVYHPNLRANEERSCIADLVRMQAIWHHFCGGSSRWNWLACHHGTAGAHQSSKILYVYPSLSDVRNITFLKNINRQLAFFFSLSLSLIEITRSPKQWSDFDCRRLINSSVRRNVHIQNCL